MMVMVMVTAMSTTKAKAMGTATATAKATMAMVMVMAMTATAMARATVTAMATVMATVEMTVMATAMATACLAGRQLVRYGRIVPGADGGAAGGAGAGASNNGGNGGDGGEAGAGGTLQAGLSTNTNADGGPSPSPSLPPYTMAPSAPLPSYEKRKTAIGYYALWQWYDCNKLTGPVNVNFAKYTWINYAFFQTDSQGNLYGMDEWADPQSLVGPYLRMPPRTRRTTNNARGTDPRCRFATTTTYPGVSCNLQRSQQLHAIAPAHQLREGGLGAVPLLLITPPISDSGAGGLDR
jgi:hypothetical protein